MRKVALHNLGCKVNAYETQAMQELLEKAGYEIVPFREGADIYVINTCTVTNIADRKSRQMLHRAKKMNPDAVVVACGCYVQAKGEEADSCIDIVVGNNKKKDLIRILDNYFQDKKEKEVELLDIGHVRQFEDLVITRLNEHVRANVKIQDGCNQFCSYCIIPYARGRVRSRGRQEILSEISALADNGYKEVVLTGIHLSSYGADTGDDLISLIEEICKKEKIVRVRLGSLEPGIITEEFAERLFAQEKFCPHFHLSLQSGCNATLKRMNRRYTSEEYYGRCELLRRIFHDPAITTDVIVGFPGESEEDFLDSKAFVERVSFYETHIFKYSPRQGTVAAKMSGQVSNKVKDIRSTQMIELGQRKKQEFESRRLGTIQEVLIEEKMTVDGNSWQVGHTKEYVKIGIRTDDNLVNQIVKIDLSKEDARLF